MFSFFTSRTLTAVTSATRGAVPQAGRTSRSVAHQLLESADASVGRDPQRAQELRDAARAFLSVVR